MKLYRLGICPGEGEGEGENWDEWFSSLREAKKRRAELIAQNPDGDNARMLEDFEIEQCEIPDLPRKRLAILLLNRRGFVTNSKQVVAPYRYDREAHIQKIRERMAVEGSW